MPSFLSLEFSVVRLRPRRSAAPSGTTDLAFGFAQDAQDVFALGGMERRIRSSRSASSSATFGLEFGERNVEDSATRQNHGALEEVFELADVAWPWPAAERLHGLVGNGLDDSCPYGGCVCDKMANEHGDIARAVTQRRGKDRENLEPIKEIAAKLLFGDHLCQIAIGGGDQANIDVDGAGATEALDFPFLQSAQKLGLQVEREFADFIEEERALVREFEAAHFAGDGSGKRALLVAEQLALDQAGRNGRTVELDKGALAARTEPVNGARQQFFAGAGLALDEDGGVGGRDGFNLLEHLAQTAALAHDVFKAVFEVDFVFEILLFLAQPVAQARQSGGRRWRC